MRFYCVLTVRQSLVEAGKYVTVLLECISSPSVEHMSYKAAHQYL